MSIHLRSVKLSLPLVLLGLGVACGRLQPEASWLDQLVPDAPCYRVDLLDGLDETSTTEIHDLYGCLNHHGHLEALSEADAALEIETRAGVTAGVELAGLTNRMREADVDPFALVSVMLDGLTADDRPLPELLDLSLELGWGDRANRIRTGQIPLDDPQALERGVLLLLAPVLLQSATAQLEDDLEALRFTGGVLQDPETIRWIQTGLALLEADAPAPIALRQGLIQRLSEGLEATRSPHDDRWPRASGDSLRDLIAFFVVRQNPVVDHISPAIDTMLSDPLIRQGLVPATRDLIDAGDLARVPPELAWLASVDVDGSPTDPAEVSALYRFIRLLSDNNREVDCSIDLFGFPVLQWSFPNLSVATLRLIADLSPGTVQDLASLVSALTGGPVTEELLELAVETEVCPDFTQQTLDDLRALEAISRPEAASLLTSVISALHVLERGELDHLPALAELCEALFLAGGLEPFEELVRDLGEEALALDLVRLIEISLDPGAHGIAPTGQDPVDLSDGIELLRWSFAPDPQTGQTGFQRLRPWMAPVLDQDETWQIVENLAALGRDDRTQVGQLLELIPRLAALDPDLVLLEQLSPLLAEAQLAGPWLRLAETDPLVEALLAPPDAARQVPLVWWGELVVTGALEDLLRLVDTLLAGLGLVKR